MTGKTLFFVTGLFCTPILFVLTLASDRAVLYGNVVFSILVLSNKKPYSSFFFFFQKTCFKVKALKKISSDCLIKHADLSNGWLF